MKYKAIGNKMNGFINNSKEYVGAIVNTDNPKIIKNILNIKSETTTFLSLNTLVLLNVIQICYFCILKPTI